MNNRTQDTERFYNAVMRDPQVKQKVFDIVKFGRLNNIASITDKLFEFFESQMLHRNPNWLQSKANQSIMNSLLAVNWNHFLVLVESSLMAVKEPVIASTKCDCVVCDSKRNGVSYEQV